MRRTWASPSCSPSGGSSTSTTAAGRPSAGAGSTDPQRGRLRTALAPGAAVLAALLLLAILFLRGSDDRRPGPSPLPFDPTPTARPPSAGRGPGAPATPPRSPASGTAPSAVERPPAAGGITGRAVDADTGAGIGGVEVVAFARGFERGARTGEDGAFEIASVPGGRIVLVAFPDEHEPANETFELEEAGARHVTLTLRVGAAVEGVVTGPRGPVEAATVEVRSAGGPPRPPLKAREARTDASGRYRVGGLAPGRARLAARAPGLAPPSLEREVETVRGGAARADFEFGAGATVEGRVVDEQGAGLAGARVAAEVEGVFTPYETTTDAAGAYRIAGLPATAAVIRATLAGHAPAGSARLGLVEGATAGGIDLVLARGARIEGRVVLADGTPAARAQVRLWDSGGGSVDAVGAGPDGRFAFEDLRAGVYRLTASFPGQLDAESRAVGVAPGPPAGVELRFGRGAGAVRGVVVDGQGRPVAGARVEAARPGDPERRVHAVTDEEGLFGLDGLEPGLTELHVRDPAAEGASAETIHRVVASGPGSRPTPLVLRLERHDGRLEGAEIVVLLAPDLAEDAAVIAVPEDGSEPTASGLALARDGSFRAGGLVPGRRYKLLVLSGPSERPIAERSLTLVEGENRVDLTAARQE